MVNLAVDCCSYHGEMSKLELGQTGCRPQSQHDVPTGGSRLLLLLQTVCSSGLFLCTWHQPLRATQFYLLIHFQFFLLFSSMLNIWVSKIRHHHELKVISNFCLTLSWTHHFKQTYFRSLPPEAQVVQAAWLVTVEAAAPVGFMCPSRLSSTSTTSHCCGKATWYKNIQPAFKTQHRGFLFHEHTTSTLELTGQLCSHTHTHKKKNVEGLTFSPKKKSISHINTEINKWHIEFLI